MGGYGTDERYESTLSFNRFKGDQRWSILAGSNNINKSTFSFNDIVSSMGGFGSRSGGGIGGGAGFGGGGGGGPQRTSFTGGSGNTGVGINRASNAGINYTNKFGNKVELQGSYFFSNTDNQTRRSSVRETYYGDSTAQLTSENAAHNINNNHRVNLRYSMRSIQ
jgi:hypothetical protein